jgi:hypothetical protein
MLRLTSTSLSVWLALAPIQALAQSNFIAPGNQNVPGEVQMGLNGAGQAVPLGGAGAAGYPPGSVAITCAFSAADTTTATCVLAAAANKFTYFCGFTVGGLGATGATIVNPTVGLLAGGNTFTYSGAYTFAAGAAVANVPFTVNPAQCIAGNALNTAITITVPGAAGNTSTTINGWGFQA